MLSHYFNITVIAEWSAFIAALLLLDKKTTTWRFFILLLLVTIGVETIGWYMNYILKRHTNALPFNILMIGSNIFFIWLFAQTREMQKVKRVLRILMILFIAFGLINLLFFQKSWIYNSYTETLGDIILAITAFYFLFAALKQDEYINLLKYEYYWLANGVLFFSLGNVVLYLFQDSLYAYFRQIKVPVYDIINDVLNFVFYSCLIIAFICRRRTTRS